MSYKSLKRAVPGSDFSTANAGLLLTLLHELRASQ